MTRLPESWYPLCRSSDLKRGAIQPLRAFQADWVAFRGEDGRAGVLRRHCPHAGANLALGRVRDNRLVCPMHCWRFGTDGQSSACDQAGTPIATGRLEVEEYLGVLYGFWGESASFPFPKRFSDHEALGSRVSVYGFSAPHELGGMNAFDIQHLLPVHRRKLVGPPEIQAPSAWHISIQYHAEVAGRTLRDALIRLTGMRVLDIEVHSYGGSLLIFEHRKAGVSAYIGMLPQSEDHTKVFLSIGRRKKANAMARALRKPFEAIENVFFRLFAAEDLKVLNGARLQTDNLDPVLDAALLRWWSHYQAMPRKELVSA